MPDGRRARVLIDSALPQLDHLFDYRVPPALEAIATPGVRVTVPLRNGIVAGYLVDLPSDAPNGTAHPSDGAHPTGGAHSTDADALLPFSGTLADIESVVSPLPVLAPEVLRLARAVADRQAGSASDLIRLAVPKRQVRVEKAELAREPSVSNDAVSKDAVSNGAVSNDAVSNDAPSNGPPPVERPRRVPPAVGGYGAELVHAVRSGARVSLGAIPQPVTVGGEPIGRWAVTVAEVLALATGDDGVAIAAVPDARDLDQLHRALEALDPDALIARLDAGRTPAERYRAFLDARAGRARFVIGNRSALYAPAEHLRAIVLWDDGDPLQAEPLAPYAHARDVALLRQEQSGAALVIAGHAETVDVARLVELGWLQRVEPQPPVRPRVVLAEDEGVAARIPSAAWQPMRAALDEGPVLVQVARPVSAARAGDAPDAPAAPDVARTAAELGRAFARIPVVQSHGEHSLDTVDTRPKLVVATRGAEPRVDGGYRAVLLLDGRRMLSREALRVAEDCRRWWSNAAALAAPRAPVLLVGVGDELGRRFALWQHHEAAVAELVDRRELRFPPAVRVVTVSGDRDDVVQAMESVRAELPTDVDWPTPLDEGGMRGVLRFDYRYGGAVARLLRAAVIANAVGRGRTRGRRSLRVRFDDATAFES